jgi:hypothetical protein
LDENETSTSVMIPAAKEPTAFNEITRNVYDIVRQNFLNASQERQVLQAKLANSKTSNEDLTKEVAELKGTVENNKSAWELERQEYRKEAENLRKVAETAQRELDDEICLKEYSLRMARALEADNDAAAKQKDRAHKRKLKEVQEASKQREDDLREQHQRAINNAIKTAVETEINNANQYWQQHIAQLCDRNEYLCAQNAELSNCLNSLTLRDSRRAKEVEVRFLCC